jgi:hypothetical protein
MISGWLNLLMVEQLQFCLSIRELDWIIPSELFCWIEATREEAEHETAEEETSEQRGN